MESYGSATIQTGRDLRCCRPTGRVAVIAACLIGLVCGSGFGQVVATHFDPGIAGQIHALAYDPTNPDIIYAGGDNCGVYRSDNHGLTWYRWNEGMMSSELRKSSYVDELIVIPPISGVVDDANVGVYAATHGGIYFRAGGNWQLQTGDLIYVDGAASNIGLPIPFCSFAFDPIGKALYAGAGKGRVDSYTPGVYPELSGYSLWRRNLDSSGQAWEQVLYIGGDGNVDRVLQIAVLVNPAGTGSRIAVAANSGVYLQDAGGESWTKLWPPSIMPLIPPNASQLAWGVGVGKAGNIYAITRRDGSGQESLNPGVWHLAPVGVSAGEYVYDTADWEEVNDPPGTIVAPVVNCPEYTWSLIIRDTYQNKTDIVTLTVVPGSESTEDELFVGMFPGEFYDSDCTYLDDDPEVNAYRPISRNGYFRYGPYYRDNNDGQGPQPTTGWVNILYRYQGLGLHRNKYRYQWVDYSTVPYSVDTFAHGWLSCYPTGSTTPYLVGPTGSNHHFASLYHIPLANDNISSPYSSWSQRYCTQSGSDEYTFNGLSIMASRDVGFTADSQMILICGDFVGFVASSAISNASRYMDPRGVAVKQGYRVLTIDNDIFVIRGGMHIDYPNGYQIMGDQSRQRKVIAQYTPGAGYHGWQYITSGLDALVTSGAYSVVDVVSHGTNTMFAAVMKDGAASDRSYVFKGTRGANDDWTWVTWWASPGADQEWQVTSLCVIPGTNRLLLSSTGGNAVSLIELHTNIQSNEPSAPPYFDPRHWLVYDDIVGEYGYEESHRLTRTIKTITRLVCDSSGQWLYIVTQGQAGHGGDESKCANVARVRIPSMGVPEYDEWDLLLNSYSSYPSTINGIQFAACSFGIPGYLNQTDRLAENLPIINSLVIHPDNPKRLLIGVQVRAYQQSSETFHANNGVWEFRPYGDGGTWHQLWGGLGEPNKGVTALAFDPEDPTRLIAGTFGQGFFRLEGVPRSQPTYADKSEDTNLRAYISGQPLNAAVFSFNNDEYQDIFITREGSGAPCLSFMGYGYHEVSNAPKFYLVDPVVLYSTGAQPAGNTRGLIIADYDNDGYEDIYVAHRDGHRLLRYTGSQYVDVTATVGLNDNYTDSMNAAWGDYDGDGYLDLLVLSMGNNSLNIVSCGAPVQRLYRNVAGPGGRVFTDVTGETGLAELQASCQNAIWVDADRDGLMDLIMISSHELPGGEDPPRYGEPSRYLRFQANGTFCDVAATHLSVPYPTTFNVYAYAVDVNRNGLLDLVVAYYHKIVVYWNDGNGNYATQAEYQYTISPHITYDLDIIDYDLDGYPDFLISGGSSTRLYASRVSGDTYSIVDETDAAGLGGTSSQRNSVPARFGCDGYRDIYLTRLAEDPFFMQANRNLVSRYWLGMELTSLHGANTRRGLGATVIAHMGSRSQSQVVDGGSGAAGQQQPELVFGFGSESGPVSATVLWPNGHSQIIPAAALQLGACNFIVDDSPVVDDSSVQLSLVYHFDGTVDWVFTWKTFNQSDALSDRVYLQEVSGPCDPGVYILEQGVSGVVVREDLHEVGDGRWEHQVKWLSRPCVAPCMIPYSVESAVSDYKSKSVTSRNIRILTCIQMP